MIVAFFSFGVEIATPLTKRRNAVNLRQFYNKPCKISPIGEKLMKNSLRILVMAFVVLMLAAPATFAVSSAKSLYASAAAKQKANNPQGAIADYTKAIERNPKDAYAYLHRGIVKGVLGDSQGALADYTKAIELDPKNPLSYSNRGVEKAQNKDYDGAIADYTKAIEINPKYSLAYNNRGIAKSKKTDNAGALADYTKAIELNPKYGLAYSNRGSVKGIMGDQEGALADYKMAAKLDDPDAKQWLTSKGYTW